MPVYDFEGSDAQNKPRKGEIRANTEAEAQDKLSAKGILVNKIKEKKVAGAEAGVGGGGGARRHAGGRVSSKQLTQITSQFSTLQDAGLPIVRSLKILSGQLKKGAMADTLATIAEDVEGGQSLSEAMQKHPRVFDILYTNMVKAGEAGGVLDVILRRLAEFMEKAQALKRKIVGASIYPIAVIMIASGILIGIMVFVIPQFEKIFKDMNKALPPMTTVLLGISRFLASRYFLLTVPPLLGLLVVAWIALGRTPAGRLMEDRLKIGIPVFGTILRKALISRFTRTLGTLVRSGVPILEALDIVRGSIGNKVIENAIGLIYDSIREGDTIHQPLKESGICDDIVVNMIAVGEETGELDTMLLKIADNYDAEVDVAVESMISILEPILIVGMGIAVGFIVIALFLPLVSLIQGL